MTDADAATFGPDDRPIGIADVELAVFDGEAVLFDVEASMVHHLNAVAGATWLCCDGETGVAAMVDELAEIFSIDDPIERDALSAGVHDSLARFAHEGLLADRPRSGRFTMTPDPVRAADGTAIVTAPFEP